MIIFGSIVINDIYCIVIFILLNIYIYIYFSQRDLDDAYLSSSSDLGSNVSPLNITDNITESSMNEFAE